MSRLCTAPVASSSIAHDSHLNRNGDVHYVCSAKCQLQALRRRCVHVSVHEKDTASAPTSPLSKLTRVSKRQTYDVDQNSCDVTLSLPCSNGHILDLGFKLWLSNRDVEVLCHWISMLKETVASGEGCAEVPSSCSCVSVYHV